MTTLASLRMRRTIRGGRDRTKMDGDLGITILHYVCMGISKERTCRHRGESTMIKPLEQPEVYAMDSRPQGLVQESVLPASTI